MKTASRRAALTVLGLAPAAAITPEDFSVAQPLSHGFLFGRDRQKVSDALRKLADDIEAGGTHVTRLDMHSALRHDEFLTHELVIQFALKGDVGA